MKWLDDGYPRVDLDLVAIKAVLRGRIQYWEQWATLRGKSADFATISLTMVEPSRPAYEM